MLRAAPAENKAPNKHPSDSDDSVHHVMSSTTLPAAATTTPDRRAGLLLLRRDGSGRNGSLKNLFSKSAEFFVPNHKNKRRNNNHKSNRHRRHQHKNHSESFSERTQSTLSMSLTSSRGAEEWRTSSMARLQRSAILNELLPLEEALNSMEINTEPERPPVSELCGTEEVEVSGRVEEDEVPVVEESQEVGPIIPFSAEYLLQKHSEHEDELAYMRFEFMEIAPACEAAQRLNKPVLAFFTELPGDEEVGQQIFSHPLLVEAMRTLCVPVLCIENDRENPVRRTAAGRRCRCSMRFLDPDTSKSLIEDSLWGDSLTLERVIYSIIKALEKLGNYVPKYLLLLHQGIATSAKSGEQVFVIGTRQPTRGEVEFASLPGVLGAKSAFLHRQRVCVITYDPKQICYSKLLRHALQQDSLCDIVYYGSNEERLAAQIELKRSSSSTPSSSCPLVILSLPEGEFRSDMASKQALRKTGMRYVPLTGMQSMKANQLIHQGQFDKAMHILSPWQGQILMRAMRGASSNNTIYDLIDVPILLAWQSVCEQKHPNVILLESRPAVASPEEEMACESDSEAGFKL